MFTFWMIPLGIMSRIKHMIFEQMFAKVQSLKYLKMKKER